MNRHRPDKTEDPCKGDLAGVFGSFTAQARGLGGEGSACAALRT